MIFPKISKLTPSKETFIVLDPGHGGKDPGAVSRKFGIREKDVNLAVALYMEDYIRKDRFSFTPVLTRRQDVFVSLKGRCEIARAHKAAVFLSIHCNAREAKGRLGIEIETYYYRGSRLGKQLAELTLKDLLSEVGKITTCIDRGVKTAGFYVLKHTPMPAALVELGFITDDEEALFLSGIRNQSILARSLAESLELFLEGGLYDWVS